MLWIAWIMAFLCSIPQTIVFSLKSHPLLETYKQCTTIGNFGEGMVRLVTKTTDNLISYLLIICQEVIYFMFVFTFTWILPLLVTLISYVSVMGVIFRRARQMLPYLEPVKYQGQVNLHHRTNRLGQVVGK